MSHLDQGEAIVMPLGSSPVASTAERHLEQDPLAVSSETMRAMGYEVIDLMVDRIATERQHPPMRRSSGRQMRDRLATGPPEGPRAFDELLGVLDRDVLRFMGRFDHPRFFGYIPGSGTWPAVLGDFIASATNIDAASWSYSAGPSQLEATVLDWFRDWVGFPAGAEGLLTSGGSAANMTALACARASLSPEDAARAVLYLSDQSHSSMVRAAKLLGFRSDRVRILETTDEFRFSPEVLERAIESDRRDGLLPFLIAAAAGSTNTGAIDPLMELAELRDRHGVWLHVDAAYGGFAVLTERGAVALAGIELADSITLDPHKWLYMPFEVGGVIVREGGKLGDAFKIVPEYLEDAYGESDQVDFGNLGMQLTRSSKAIKVWLSLQFFGVPAFRDAIDRAMDLACWAEEYVRDSSTLELVTPARLGILTFRRLAPGVDDEEAIAEINGRLVDELSSSGLGFVSSTRLGGRYVIRLCVLNHSTDRSDVRAVLKWFEGARV